MIRRPGPPARRFVTAPRVLFAAALVAGAVMLSSAPGRLDAMQELPARDRTSWTTYGFDVSRSGWNPHERSLGASNVADLHLAWQRPLDGVSITSPVVAADVGPRHRQVAYVGTEHGLVEAVDVLTGRPLWQRRFGSVRVDCGDIPDDRYGVSATPVIDPERGLLYVAATQPAHVAVHALDLATGRDVPGWPVVISTDPEHMHVWGGLTLFRHRLYAAFAGMCDLPPYYGKVVAIDTRRATYAEDWFAVRDGGYPVGGGGVWGYGGVSVDPRDGAVYAATGNALGPYVEDHSDGESVVRLTAALREMAAHKPRLSGWDIDFGATPLLYRAQGCPPQLAVMNKAGAFYVYDRDRIADGPVQGLLMAGNRTGGLGLFIGIAAFSPRDRMVYVADPGPDHPPFRHGMVAFLIGRDCLLHLAWQQVVGEDSTTTLSSPTVANGVVYFADGDDGRVVAFDTRTGARLWDSGRSLGGPAFVAPVVVNGRVLVVSWDGDGAGRLSAFVP